MRGWAQREPNRPIPLVFGSAAHMQPLFDAMVAGTFLNEVLGSVLAPEPPDNHIKIGDAAVEHFERTFTRHVGWKIRPGRH